MSPAAPSSRSSTSCSRASWPARRDGAVRLAQYRWGGQRHPGRHQRRQRPAPTKLPSPPTYRKVNPADRPILILSRDFGRAAADRGRRQGRYEDGPADQPDRRRRAGDDRRTTEAGDPGPDRSRAGSLRRTVPSKMSGRALVISTVNNPKGQHRRRERATTRFTPTTSSPKAGDWNDVIIAYRNGAPLRVRDIGRPSADRRTTRRPHGPTTSGACSWSCSSSPAPTSSRRWTASRRELPRLRAAHAGRLSQWGS